MALHVIASEPFQRQWCERTLFPHVYSVEEEEAGACGEGGGGDGGGGLRRHDNREVQARQWACVSRACASVWSVKTK